MLMAKSFHRSKRQSFTILELFLSLSLITLIFLPLSISGYTFLKEWQYKRDVFALKSQLQLAYDMVLHCDIPIKVHFIKRKGSFKKGVTCSFELENKFLEKKLPAKRYYPYIQKIQINNLPFSRNIIFSSAGDYAKPITLDIVGFLKKQTMSMEIKGYPHVLEVEKK